MMMGGEFRRKKLQPESLGLLGMRERASDWAGLSTFRLLRAGVRLTQCPFPLQKDDVN